MLNGHRASSKIAREVGFCDGTIAEPGGEADREDRVAAVRDVTKWDAVHAAGHHGIVVVACHRGCRPLSEADVESHSRRTAMNSDRVGLQAQVR